MEQLDPILTDLVDEQVERWIEMRLRQDANNKIYDEDFVLWNS